MPFVQQQTATAYLQNPEHINGSHRDLEAEQTLLRQQQQQQQPQRGPPRSDLVMVFPYKTRALVRWGEAAMDEESRGLQPPTEKEKHRMETWQAKRSTVLHSLSDSGLILMLYYSRDRDEIFVRVAADVNHLRAVAEMRRYKLELKPQYLSAFAEYKNDYAGRRELNYSDRCVVSHIYKSHGGNDEAYPQPGAIFRTVDRIRLIDHIVRAMDHNCAGADVGQLMHEGDLLHYFPMHEHKKLAILDKDWFKCFAWGTHIDEVRDYFGERIALYFLFMSHLNKWLILPALVGIPLSIVELPQPFALGTPDNFTAIFLCIGMGFWAVFFIHFWRRTAATHALKWGTLGMGKQLEPTRPEFVGVSRINPVTGRVDRYYPWSERIWRVLFSASVLSVAIVSLVFCILVLFCLRRVFHEQNVRFTFMVINAVVVEMFNAIFTNVAKWLTDRENHRAYSEYQNHLLAKTVVFKFVNCYVSLYYIAFFKDNTYLFSVPMECVNSDCLNDLGMQLAVFMVTRLTLQNFLELGLPYLLMAYRNFKERRTFHMSLFANPLTIMPDLSSAEKQSKKEDYDVYEDMDEVLVLYGYTTLFVVACPWVPLVALLSSILECFLDQKKLVFLYRRPFPMPAANNEPWDTAFDIFGILAMMTNTAVIVFSSNAFEGMSHAHKGLMFLGIEHAMIFGRLIVSFFMPAVPTSVKVLQMQQNVMVHRHLNLGGEEDDHETRANAMMTTQTPPPFVFDADEDEEEG
mmetsp:Transcript_67035/g.169851  ORF Transcript_67035/g.169851 Transcript_67035/m.169851 type:complete len:744 (-) Transcript_67035:130-2361(-)